MASQQRGHLAGFSLVELVAVVLILGLLIAAAAPRLDMGRGVDELGYSQKVLTDLRLAQRRAQADRCDVRIVFSAGGFQVGQRAALCSGPFSRPVSGMAAASSNLGGGAPGGMPLSATPVAFYFDSSGAVRDSVGGSVVDVVITAGPRQITIVGATGYASF